MANNSQVEASMLANEKPKVLPTKVRFSLPDIKRKEPGDLVFILYFLTLYMS